MHALTSVLLAGLLVATASAQTIIVDINNGPGTNRWQTSASSARAIANHDW